MVDNRLSWEQRAARCGTSLSGVLFRGLSNHANEAVHAWHAWVVEDVLANSLALGTRVLDLGCGYGRLSKVLLRSRPDLSVVGQDLSANYCRLFLQNGLPCVRADAAYLPFADESFDGVMAVTCLMYAEPKSMPGVLSNLLRVVRPGGIVLLLDPALELQQAIARIRGQQAHSPTGGQGFKRSGYIEMIAASGFTIVASGGNPALSTALLIPGLARSEGAWSARLLGWCARKDCRRSGFSAAALHRWVLARRGLEGP